MFVRCNRPSLAFVTLPWQASPVTGTSLRSFTIYVLVGVALPTLTLVVGCGSSPGTPLPDAGPPAGSLVSACPPSIPDGGSPCPAPGQIDCEYGNDWNSQCNTIAQCWRGGPLDATWQIQLPYSGVDFSCPTPTTLSPGCPSSPPDSQIGSVTACSYDGGFCAYGDVMCDCIQQGSSSATPDASYAWICSNPGLGCPAARPRIGSACTSAEDGVSCQYAVCAVGSATYCTGGVWTYGVLNDYCD